MKQAVIYARFSPRPGAEQIREFRILPVDFSESGGEMTPTMKVKRAVVADKYADAIAGIYAGRKQPA